MATSAEQQVSIDFAGRRAKSATPVWLGFTLHHRDLFDALQDEWARAPQRGARILGVERFPAPEVAAHGPNAILVHVAIDLRQLPKIAVRVRRAGEWTEADISEVHAEDEAIDWPGALPLFAITRLKVATLEQRARLAALAKQVSNVSLPDAIEVDGAPHRVGAIAPPDVVSDEFPLPGASDPLRGAITMAIWGVPRIEPWLDILVKRLSVESAVSAPALQVVHAPWWESPPWSPPKARAEGTHSPQLLLWEAAKAVFRSSPPEASLNLAQEVARVALDCATDSAKPEIDAWLEETFGILRADVAIHASGFRNSPVGKAIQLVLARPQPSTFKTWVDDLPTLPPGVWWTAATLCGLLTGYRRLDTQFRGEPSQRALIAYHALRCAGDGSGELVSLAPSNSPSWRRDSGGIVLSWNGVDFPRKPEHARGKWFTADLSRPKVRHAAWSIAARASWSCASRELVLGDQSLPISGDGTLTIQGEPSTQLVATGVVRLRLPSDFALGESLDDDAFRRCMAEEGAVEIPEPPHPSREPSRGQEPNRSEHLIVREPGPQAALWVGSQLPRQVTEVPGLVYADEFLSEGDEAKLVAIIDDAEWLSDLSRRVQHYGWRYDYEARAIDSSMRLGPLPEWAERLARRLVEQGFVPHLADQVIVNEYVENQGIAPHVDCETCFADGIAMISLLESWEMIFKPRRGKGKVAQRLERRSIAVMSGDARYEWSHEIPKRKTEPKKVRRGRRLSITLRKVIGVEPG